MENITASSSSLNYQPIEAQLDSSSCWKPLTDNDPNDFLQVDLGSIKLLQRVDTKALTPPTYVETYKIQYSTDGVKWEYYPNFDGTPKVLTYFSKMALLSMRSPGFAWADDERRAKCKEHCSTFHS